jgi:transposase-like protein
MIVSVVVCPHCHKPDAVVRHGTTDSGTPRCRCRTCSKTFSPQPKSRQLTDEKRQTIERALAERLSQRAIARCHRVSYKTIREVAQAAQKNNSNSPTP